MNERVQVAFDTEETEVYERLDGSDTFIVRMTEGEALMLRDQIEEELEELFE